MVVAIRRGIRRRRRYRRDHQSGAGIFDLIRKGAKFLGVKKARNILNMAKKGLSMADKIQRGLASQYPEEQSGAGALMLGGASGRRRRRKLNASQVKQMRRLYHRSVGGRRRGRSGRQRGAGINQNGGFIGWLIKQFM